MRKISIFLILILFNVCPGFAADAKQESINFDRWMTDYYVEKDSTKVGQFLEWLEKTQPSDKNHAAFDPLISFLSMVFVENPKQVPAWTKGLKFTGGAKDIVDESMVLSKDRKKLDSIFKSPINQPAGLDIMWAAFFASGNQDYVKKIIDVLDENAILNPDIKVDELTREAAKWSLGSNAIQHELVDRVIRKEIKTRPDPIKTKLTQIMAENDKKKYLFPNRDGDFSAMLLVTDSKSFDKILQHSAPVDGEEIAKITQAKRGDIVMIKILFSGMALKDNLSADVVFDFKVLGPDGKVYDGAEEKNSTGLKSKVSSRFNVYDDPYVMKLEFEPKDKAGTYQLVAKVKDKVGKKSVALLYKIDLKE